MTNYRAPSSGISLSDKDVSIAKGMLLRGDRQHDIAAWFGVNGGRIAELSTGIKYQHIAAAPTEMLPPSGPYLSGKDTEVLVHALDMARSALDEAEKLIIRK